MLSQSDYCFASNYYSRTLEHLIGYSFVNLYLNFFAPNVYMCYRPQLEPETSEPSISEFDSPQLHPTHYSNIHHQRRMYDDGTQNIEEASVS